jgi:hypothetical protein
MMLIGLNGTRGAGVSISLFGSHLNGWGFTRNTESIPGPAITINQGDVVTLSLTSTDGLTHRFLLDYNGNGLADSGEPLSPLFSSSIQITFTATVAGSFSYFCTIHPGTMYGTWTTKGTNSPPSVTPLSADISPAIPDQQVTFTSTASDADGDAVSWTLLFGDGASATGSTPAGGGTISAGHAYAANGMFTATLNANDPNGGSASSSTTISVATSFLRVTTNPAVPGKIIVDGVPRDEWGLAWMKIAPGTHTVSFGGLNGLGTPADQTVTVTAGATKEVVGNYAAYGYLRVITNPAVASTISVNGVPRDDWGMWTALPPGTYTMHFGAVAGFNPPADMSATVMAGSTTTITGDFVANPSAPGPDPSTYGLLRVTTNPATAAQILVNNVPRDDWGLAWVKLPPGTYTVSFGQGYGYTAPAPKTVTVTAGATATWDAPFVVHGSLRVTTSPALAATIFVDGVPRDDWGMWQSMPPGTYTVSFGSVPGYVTPASQTATVTANTLTTKTGTYVAAASASAASLSGLAIDAGSGPLGVVDPPTSFAVATSAAPGTRNEAEQTD